MWSPTPGTVPQPFEHRVDNSVSTMHIVPNATVRGDVCTSNIIQPLLTKQARCMIKGLDYKDLLEESNP